MKPRTTILGLMGVVAVVALGAVALRESNEMWASCLFSVTLLILGLACLGAASRRGAYGGFAAFGLGYLFLVYGPWAATEIRPHLLTTKLLGHAGARLMPQDPDFLKVYYSRLFDAKDRAKGAFVADVDTDGTPDIFVSNGTATAKPGRSVASFERIGHSLFALAFGLVGGVAARYFRGTRTESSP